MTERLNFHTPVGRFVSGSLTERRDKDQNNRPIEPDKQRFEFGVAIRKDDPGLMPMLQQIGQYAKGAYSHAPAVVARIDQWFTTMHGFSMKVSDGDKPNARGVVNPNTVGCFVIWYNTSMDVLAANASNQQIDIASIKRGWYVDVASNVSINGLLDHNAGVYMNPNCIRLIAEGDEILGGLTVDAALENAPVASTQLPPGARPVGSTPQPPASSGAPGTGMAGLPGVSQGGVATAPVTGVGGLPGTETVSHTEHPAHPGILGAGGLPGA